jgi:hypothetical protein
MDTSTLFYLSKFAAAAAASAAVTTAPVPVAALNSYAASTTSDYDMNLLTTMDYLRRFYGDCNGNSLTAKTPSINLQSSNMPSSTCSSKSSSSSSASSPSSPRQTTKPLLYKNHSHPSVLNFASMSNSAHNSRFSIADILGLTTQLTQSRKPRTSTDTDLHVQHFADPQHLEFLKKRPFNNENTSLSTDSNLSDYGIVYDFVFFFGRDCQAINMGKLFK